MSCPGSIGQTALNTTRPIDKLALPSPARLLLLLLLRRQSVCDAGRDVSQPDASAIQLSVSLVRLPQSLRRTGSYTEAATDDCQVRSVRLSVRRTNFGLDAIHEAGPASFCRRGVKQRACRAPDKSHSHVTNGHTSRRRAARQYTSSNACRQLISILWTSDGC